MSHMQNQIQLKTIKQYLQAIFGWDIMVMKPSFRCVSEDATTWGILRKVPPDGFICMKIK